MATSAAAQDSFDVVDVGPVWAGHPVGFALLTHPPHQFAAYYDTSRQLTVASRKLDEAEWTYQRLPQEVGWDSHNSIVLTADKTGRLHLAANMHVTPLIYFRTEQPFEISTFRRIPEMVGRDEERCTYPRFFRGPDERLLFTYRSGKSGDGVQIYNVYDPVEQHWRRLLDTPLVDGEGERNAYLHGPNKGPDGYYHLVWVWRDTPDCATNHDLSYARSKDLVHWERSDGTPLSLPITLDTAEIVDPVPPGGGLINGNAKLGFDSRDRPVIAYHKYDKAGATQLFNARLEEGDWKIYQTSDWDYRWAFQGGGSIPFEIRVRPVRSQGGRLTQSYSHVKRGSGRWLLDEDTLRPIESLPPPAPALPKESRRVESDFPGMGVRVRGDAGSSSEKRYYLRWETLGPNRDRPREKPWPEPSMLQVIELPR